MSVYHNAGISQSGLVFSYDMNNIKKSWRGQPTTNYIPYPIDDWNGSAFATGYLYDAGSTHTFTRVSNVETPLGLGTVMQYYTGSSNYKYFSIDASGVPVGTATFSYYSRIVNGPASTSNINNAQIWRANGVDQSVTGDWGPTHTTEWKRWATTGPTTTGGVLQYFLNHSGSLTGGYTIQYCGFQLEMQSSATPWVNGSRSNTQSLIDLSNNTTLTAESLTYSNNQFSFVSGSSNSLNTGAIAGTGSATTSFTLCAWVYPSATAGNIISFSSTNPIGGWNMPPLYTSGQQFKGCVWNNNVLSSSTFTLNTWYYVALVFNYAAGAQYLYVNGKLADSQTGITYSSSGASNYLFIGRANPGALNSGYFNGYISSVQVYTSKALSGDEIFQNFAASRGIYGV